MAKLDVRTGSEVSRLRHANEELAARNAELMARLDHERQHVAALSDMVTELAKARIDSAVDRTERPAPDAGNPVMHARLAALEAELAAMRTSRSWRVT